MGSGRGPGKAKRIKPKRIKPGDPGQVIAPVEIACRQVAQAGQPGDQVREEIRKRGGKQAPPPL